MSDNLNVIRSSAYWELGLDALDMRNYIAVNHTLIRKYGLHVAVMIGELVSEAKYYRDRGMLKDGWFFSTVDNIESNTGLSGHFQRESLERMQELGIVEVDYKGLPRKRYFRIDAMKVIMEMSSPQDENAGDSKCLTTLTTGGEHREQLGLNLVDDNNSKEQPIRTTVKKKNRGFTPPTLEEVKAYCDERHNSVDPESFIAYYESQGWKKANGQRVASWQGCVRTWEKNSNGRKVSRDSNARGTGSNEELGSLGYLKGRTDVEI